jgi:site-specific recombinase XerD
MSRPASPTFATLVQEFFTDYMVQQRALSPRTVASYRDTFVLLLRFAQRKLGKDPVNVQLADITAKFLASFLDDLESERHNCVRSRNIRLAAVRSFLKFAARRDPANLRAIEQALAVPMKRFDRKMVGFVPREQMLAVIDAPTDTWVGQRDRLLLTLMFNTGARVSEIIGVRVADVVLGPTSSIRLHGKGRKQRSLPLWKTAARAVRDWLHVNPHPKADSPLLPRRGGQPMTRASECGATPEVGSQGSLGEIPRLGQYDGVATHRPPLDRDEPASVRGRSVRDRAVARTREPVDHAHVRRGRSRDEGACLGKAEAAGGQASSIPPAQGTDAVPAGSVIM